MRILLINKYHFLKGGAERAYFDMARMLEERGHTVAFFSMRHPNNETTPWEKYFVENVEYQESKVSWWQKLRLTGKILFNFEAQQQLERLIDEFHPDIAHIHNIYHQLSPSLIWTLKKHGIPIVMTLHDYKLVSPNYNLFVRGKIWEHTSGLRCIIDRAVKGSVLKSVVCALEKWLHMFLGSYDKIDVFLAPSKFLMEKFRTLGFKHEIAYLPHSLAPRKESQGMVEQEKDTFLYFGRLSSEKGVDTLLEAFAFLGDEKKLWIVGDGPDRKKLEALAEEKHIASRVTFLGARYGDELETLKQKAEAIVLPSCWYENFPYTVIESLQSGCVVIAADRGGISERITHGENGLLFEAGNVQALVETLRSLDKVPLGMLRARAKKSVADLTEESFATQLLGIYTALFDKKRVAKIKKME
ncbi:MAG: glycosyltransferase [bacterium]|nr:glycosyltransferase [bacterium]